MGHPFIVEKFEQKELFLVSLVELFERAQKCYFLGPTSLIGCLKDNGHIVETRVFHKALEEVDTKQTYAHAVMPVDT